ncbi:MAG: class I adenylate-forming enzyme family protein [Candidatus Nanopelagicales bacterium]
MQELPDGIELLTPSAAQDLAAQFVGGLRAAGVPEGARIVLQAPNSARLLSAVLGCLLGGYVPVPISDKLTARERDELIADVEPALIVDAEVLAAAFDHEPAPLGERFRCRPMHFTSGTSGRPKGVWSGWLDDEDADALLAEERDMWGIGPDDVYLAAAPMSHSAPLRFPLITLRCGGSVLVTPAFDPHVVSQLIESGAATTAFFAPAHLQRILDNARPARHSMRLLMHAGSACPDHVRRAAREVFGDDVLREFYGSTEGQFTTCTPAEFDAHPGTVGRARPGRALRIADDGRIWCRAPRHARFEYWRDAAKTAQTWDGDWFTVGDLGRLDDEGYLFIDGRRSDLIITGGVNVYPAEIERVVLDLPEVSQACAFGVDDDRWGQRVCLAVVGDVSADRIRAACKAGLAAYKRPKDVLVVDDLPHTHSGKVDRLRIASVLGLG